MPLRPEAIQESQLLGSGLRDSAQSLTPPKAPDVSMGTHRAPRSSESSLAPAWGTMVRLQRMAATSSFSKYHFLPAALLGAPTWATVASSSSCIMCHIIIAVKLAIVGHAAAITGTLAGMLFTSKQM